MSYNDGNMVYIRHAENEIQKLGRRFLLNTSGTSTRNEKLYS
jgi:hypothetical protein